MIKPVQPVADDAPHILVVDDDNRIRALLSRYLTEQGYRVTTAENAASGRARIEALAFDLLILDVMMPGENGFELARSIRAGSEVPILMLTAQGNATDRIHGLEIGADDYLPKPFEPRELLLRIGNILRRAPAVASEPARDSVSFGGFIFHVGRGELQHEGETIRITERERDMLRLLVEAPGETVDRFALAGPASDASNERTVDVQINRLRRKIERDPSNPVYLQTVRGSGYRLVVDP
ncbi:response regulator [Labrys wisconsinensis]|uniref:Two-component system phosphate regulon response regulator OmpR n=1 Tax=Labrys wisconsinensis TaxID=425677 RepID=A0ABU0JKN9_9HYPH|nr:response regulator transcription factor [Labrys wisconsinensis]MDQ0473702.1 two-component system phosphate regulon response regulator OmpR [Labrys wisconsinensis]